VTLKNRFIRSATWDGLGAADGGFTKTQRELYRKLAAGGVGLITTGYIAVSPEGRRNPTQNLLVDLRQQEGLAEIARIVHDHGARLAAQLVHCGGLARSLVEHRKIFAPSAVEHPLFAEEAPHKMAISEIKTTIAAFAAAAARAREAGCDLVQIHSAHGYLISQFLSPFSNRRRDGYGGDLAGRSRFLLEIYQRIRKSVGDDYTITIKINGADYLADGLTLAESLEAARQLAALGLDGVEVSGGNQVAKPLTPVPTGIRPGKNEVPFAAEISSFATNLSIPVIGVGGIRSLETALSLRRQGVALVSLCRPLIREPDLITRWQKGDHRPAACISCNRCFIPAFKGQGITCQEV
jgi:2,4-dienoyl-CoA reductase-like NADH-dependent reductase (Old Yellow Enzyme family)